MNTVDTSTVVKALREMSAYLQIKGENAFKTRAYEVAADRIAGLTEDLDTLVAQAKLTSLPGIGESIGAKITELVTTGHLAALDALKAEFPPHFLELLDVPDLGPKKAKVLFEQLQIGTLDDLERACQLHQLQTLKGFGAKTEEKLLAGVAVLRRQRAAGGRRCLGEVLPQAEALLQWIKGAPGVIRASLGGSVRRMKETVADVDLIASAPQSEPVFTHFRGHPHVAQVLASGESKCSVRLKDSDLQVDLRVLPDEDFAAALHHFTGSKAHHIRLRSLAQEQGLTVSEWGVFRAKSKSGPRSAKAPQHDATSQKLPLAREEDLYALLKMQFVPPELREDWGEVEAALAHTLPTDLVTQDDIVGNVHVHSAWSDGRDSLETIAKAAQSLGFSYITVTDHSQTAHYAGGLSLDRLKAQWDEIDRLNEKLKGITLLKGIESDILDDGRLDYSDYTLAQLDVVIGSIHHRFAQDEDAATARVLAALDNPHLMIWGHPSGRLLLKRAPMALRMEEILDKVALKGVAIEVNGCPDRIDLAPEHIRSALRRGIKLVVSTDAHSVGELASHLRFGIAAARRGWARREDVLNTRSATQFVKRIKRV